MSHRKRLACAGSTALLLALLLSARSPVRAGEAAPSGADSAATDLTEMSLDQLMKLEVESVYGASRYSQRGLDAPSRVTVLTADDIRDHGYRTLAEALRAATGVYITNDRNYEYIGMRGVGHDDDYNARVLVLVDEHRLNDNLFESALIGTDFPVDIEQVDRIEVIRGPSSALYGSNALLGVINVVTRRARQTHGFEVSGQAGGLGTRGGRVAYSHTWAPRVSLQVSGSVFASDGITHLAILEFASPQTHDGVADDLDADLARRLYADLTVGDLRLQGVYGTRHKDVPTASWGTEFDARPNRTIDTRGWLDLAYHHTFPDRMDVSGRAYFDDYEYTADYPYHYAGTDSGSITINHDEDLGRWAGVDLSAHRTLFGADELVVGGEYRNNLRQDQRNWDISPYALYVDDSRQSRVWALYAEDAIQLSSRLRLTAGARHDDYTNFGGSTHPRVGLIVSLRDRTVLKFIYGSAFRVPTTYELYFGGDGYHENVALQPETFRTGEISLESYFADHLRLSASWFVYRAEDFIHQVTTDSVSEYYNGGALRGTGVEVGFQGRWRTFEFKVGAAHQDVRLSPGDTWPSNSPKDLALAMGKATLLEGRLWASADLHAMGRRRDPLGFEVPGYAVTDANVIARAPGRSWQVTLGVRNLFDTSYGDVGGFELREVSVPQDGRTFRARLDLRF